MTLPLLPGYNFPDPTQTKFHKSQALVFENGVMAIHPNVPGIGGKLLPGQEPAKETISSTSIYNQIMGGDFQTGQTVPAWVAFGSQVLRFYGYFKEPIFSSQQENYRVRHVTILFFLEDDTIQILEPRERNSGIPQGTFLRRHRAKKDDDSYVNVGDFRVGHEFTLYGRTYFLSDCDKFTENFMAKINRTGEERTRVPDDPYLSTRNLREYEETHRNRGVPKPEMLKLRQFLANDGHVLRFFAYWDDRDRPFGDMRHFVIYYFLADDTMEVNEVLRQNDGKYPFPSFVRRTQIPKEVLALSENDPRFLSADHYYRPPDLRIGATINILNRRMFIYDCDQFTRDWYKSNYGYTDQEMAPLFGNEPQSQTRTKVTIEIPPKSLIGSEEDTIRNVFSLHPTPPPKDEKKLIEKMHDCLRFTARMITKNTVDASRKFIITYFLNDDTVQIYEPPQRNSGIVAGKYLQRIRMKNPETGEYFKPADFEVGRVLTINGVQYELLQATEYAMSYMEADPDNFPQSDLVSIIERLRYLIKRSDKTPKEIFIQYSDHGKMDVNLLMELFKGVGYEITRHEACTVMRRYNQNEAITLREFLQIVQ